MVEFVLLPHQRLINIIYEAPCDAIRWPFLLHLFLLLFLHRVVGCVTLMTVETAAEKRKSGLNLGYLNWRFELNGASGSSVGRSVVGETVKEEE